MAGSEFAWSSSRNLSYHRFIALQGVDGEVCLEKDLTGPTLHETEFVFESSDAGPSHEEGEFPWLPPAD
jgi:hypothetical protein